MSSEQLIAKLAESQQTLIQTIQEVTKLQTKFSDQTEQSSQQHKELLTTTNILVEHLKTAQLQTTDDPNFPIFNNKTTTIQEWIQEIHERSQIQNLSEQSKVLYAKLAMPEQKGHLHDITSDTKWSDFVTLVTDKFQPRHATHDLIQRIRSLKMKTYQLQTYMNEFERLK